MSNPKPGDFPIGSALSRAAARMLLKNQRDTRKRIQMVTNAFFAEDEAGRLLDTSKPLATPWTGNAETLVRILCVPDGMTKEEAMRIVDRTN